MCYNEVLKLFEMFSLFFAAVLIAALHTLANPSHYLPFVALGKANAWGAFKSSAAAAFCGLGHIVGFAIFAAAGIALGEGVKSHFGLWEVGESLGKSIFVLLGFAYCAYGLRFAMRVQNAPSAPCACGSCGTCSMERAARLAENPARVKSFWVLFLVFCISPCDAIVPLVFYPAVQENPILGMFVVGGGFYAATILAMFALTFLIYGGVSKFRFKAGFFERWAHFITGLVIALSGLALFFAH